VSDEAIARNNLGREERWSESLAVGSRDFVAKFQDQLKSRCKSRQLIAEEDGFIIRERLSSYGAVFGPENRPIDPK